jgi:hypothetical protein
MVIISVGIGCKCNLFFDFIEQDAHPNVISLVADEFEELAGIRGRQGMLPPEKER